MWQTIVRLAEGSPIPFADWLEQNAAGVSVFEDGAGGWTITALYAARPDPGLLSAAMALAAAAEGVAEPAIESAPVVHADWLAAAYAGFPPLRVGRFWIHGSHVETVPPAGLLPLWIDAATAFGSGEHATTEGCLRALGRVRSARPGIRRALDMGTGSGILAIAAAKAWPGARIAAVDIDADSARVARVNAALNGVAGRVRTQAGNGFRAPLARSGAGFDLIFANILARPLIRMAPALAGRLLPGGIVILSGLLGRQAPAVLAAYRMARLSLVARVPIGEWQTLVLTRR